MEDWESAFRGKSRRRARRIDWQRVRLQILALAIIAMVVATGLIALHHWT